MKNFTDPFKIFLLLFGLLHSIEISGQHVGINTDVPEYPLQVNVDSTGIAPILDQSNPVINAGWELTSSQAAGQTFVCGMTGPLCQVKLTLGGTAGTVYVHVNLGNGPDQGIVLGSTELFIAGGDPIEYTFAFPPPYSTINAGQTYFIKLLNLTGGNLHVNLATDNPYSQGVAFLYTGNWGFVQQDDLTFKQYIEGPDTTSVLAFAVQDNGRVRIKDYELPEVDGNQNQIMSTNGNGQVEWKYVEQVVSMNNIHDLDGNTKVHTEQSANEDAIRFTLGGTEKMSLVKNQFNAARLNILDVGENVFIGKDVGLMTNPTLGFYNTYLGFACGKENTNGSYNTAIGHNAFKNNSLGNGNTMMGEDAGSGNTNGVSNTAIGHMAMKTNTSGNYNSALGWASLKNNDTGSGNTALGTFALYYNSSGIYNTALGFASLQSNTIGKYNIALGFEAQLHNISGDENVAIGKYALHTPNASNNNIAIGTETLRYTTTGDENTAMGLQALRANTIGDRNCAIGSYSLAKNTTGGYNAALGYNTLFENTTGSYNTAMGRDALHYNLDATENTGIGGFALYFNATGDGNTAIGYDALKNTTTAHNVAVGTRALNVNASGANRTAVGYQSNNAGNSYNNNTGIGYLTNCTASNQVRIGNSSVTSIGGYEDWTNVSDSRFKRNIEENVPGLEFIKRLRPVTYNMSLDAIDDFFADHYDVRDSTENLNLDKELIRYTGFIAQEVESAATEIGYDFSGVDKPKNEDDFYGLRYAQFVVPLVKAIQELSIQNQTLQQQIDFLQAEVAALKANGD